MQTLLLQNHDPNLRAYFIWGPYLNSDTVDIARANTDRFLVPNATYFWTPTKKLAEDVASVLELPGGHLGWDVYLLYRKGVNWGETFPEPTYWAHQIGVVQGEPLDRATFGAHMQQLLRAK